MDRIVSSQEIVKTIIKNENLHPGDKISYDRLIELSKKYNIAPNILAINVFGVTEAQFHSINSKSSNAKNFIILKHMIPEMIENAVGLKDTIMQEEHLSEGDSINYDRLQSISKKYNIPEKVLAINVLQISEYSYRKIKNNSNERARIFYRQKHIETQIIRKNETVSPLRQQILTNEGLKIGDKINYDFLVQLSKKYQVDERKLATDVLGITINSFHHIKSDRKRNAVILKGFLSNDELEKMSARIIDTEGLKPYDQIDYNMLITMSEKYSINEKILALNILGITESQYWNMKYHQDMKSYVLKGNLKKQNQKN